VGFWLAPFFIEEGRSSATDSVTDVTDVTDGWKKALVI
jgi:hypothetical protein